MNQDSEHLKLLSIFHYVTAGLAALFSCIPFLHFWLGIMMVTGQLEPSDPALEIFGWFFVVFAGGFILCGWAFSVAVFMAGRALARRTRYMFCLVMAGIECMFMPFGTVLGVFTILVLMRDSVKRQFGIAEESVPERPSSASE